MSRMNWDRVRVQDRERQYGFGYADDDGRPKTRKKRAKTPAKPVGTSTGPGLPVVCPMCAARLATRSRLEKHVNRVHGGGSVARAADPARPAPSRASKGGRQLKSAGRRTISIYEVPIPASLQEAFTRVQRRGGLSAQAILVEALRLYLKLVESISV